MPKRKNNQFIQFLPQVLVGVGILLILVSSAHRVLRNRALSMDKQTVAELTQKLPTKTVPKPTHILIPWFLDVDIEEEVFDGANWTVSENKASHLAQSANPGESGNIIIYGHNKREILGNIRALKGGEKVTIKTDDGKEHLYKVQSWYEVNPDNMKYLQPTEGETLTMYTCSGLLDSKRFVVRATSM